MSSPAYRAGSSGSVTAVPASSSGDVDKPSGTVEGDIVFIHLQTTPNSHNPVVSCSGFAEVTRQAPESDKQGHIILWKRAGGSEPSAYTVSQTGGVGTLGAYSVSYSGATTSGTPYEDVELSGFLPANSPTWIDSTPTVTSTESGTTYIAFAIDWNQRDTTFQANAGLTMRRDYHISGYSGAIFDHDLAAAGAYSSGSISTLTGGSYSIIALALKGEGGGTVVPIFTQNRIRR